MRSFRGLGELSSDRQVVATNVVRVRTLWVQQKLYADGISVARDGALGPATMAALAQFIEGHVPGPPTAMFFFGPSGDPRYVLLGAGLEARLGAVVGGTSSPDTRTPTQPLVPEPDARTAERPPAAPMGGILMFGVALAGIWWFTRS
jgi:lysozyme family protein